MFKNVSKLLYSKAFQGMCPCPISRKIALKKRFYRQCNIVQANGVYEVTLDQKKLKTPKGTIFQVDNEPLALAVAAEWDAQKDKIVLSSMHLTGLCSTAIDNPDSLTKEVISEELVGYLESDTILFLSDEDGELFEKQLKEWVPVTEWLCKRYDVNITPSRNISGVSISDLDKHRFRKHFMSYNLWSLVGFRFAIEALKSVSLGLACVDRHITVEESVRLSRLEEDFQSQRWGRVEWAHDLNEYDTRARVAAGALFAQCSSSTYLRRNKSVSEKNG